MDRNAQYRAIVRRHLEEYADVLRRCSPHQTELVFDEERGHYHVGEVGWDGKQRVDNVYLHVDIIGETIWIQRNATEIRIAEEFFEDGIPREHIVLGFKHPAIRPDTDYAAA